MSPPTMRRKFQCICCAYENQWSPYSPLHGSGDTICEACAIGIEDGRKRIAEVIARRKREAVI